MSLMSSWIKVTFVLALACPLQAGMKRKRAINMHPNCSVYKDRLYTCTREYYPVCATNGRTFSNKCVFCSAMIESKGSFDFRHYGLCRST